jgi:Resolvase, N terminal domain
MKPESPKGSLRCAVYTRVSTEHGLEQEFNSLANQPEASEAYINGQAHEGWRLMRDRHDDGGFSGGSMERPALKKLLDTVRARRIASVSAKTYCAMIISDTWKFVHGAEPPPKSRSAAEAAEAYWRAAGGDPHSLGENPLPAGATTSNWLARTRQRQSPQNTGAISSRAIVPGSCFMGSRKRLLDSGETNRAARGAVFLPSAADEIWP